MATAIWQACWQQGWQIPLRTRVRIARKMSTRMIFNRYLDLIINLQSEYSRVGLNGYNKIMRNNFDINIPTIPSKNIKFKIQDIKTTAFGSQKNRFQQNKGFLTKKFIDSFNNFREKSRQVEEETQAESRVQSRAEKKSFEQDYRMFVPEEKKHMLYHVDKYKNYQAPLLKETKYNRGYSFYKTQMPLTNNPQRREHSYSSVNEHQNSVSDNYFFPSTRIKDASGDVKIKKNIPSSMFKNQTRNRVYTKIEAKVNSLGPGQYFSEKPAQINKKQKLEKVKAKQDVDYNRLKKIITNIVVNEPENPIIEQQQKEKEAKLNYMFIKDDRDRFGDQKYPIVPRNFVPGPGAYAVKNSIEEQAQKVIVVEQQRKLLKDWFNN